VFSGSPAKYTDGALQMNASCRETVLQGAGNCFLEAQPC